MPAPGGVTVAPLHRATLSGRKDMAMTTTHIVELLAVWLLAPIPVAIVVCKCIEWGMK